MLDTTPLWDWLQDPMTQRFIYVGIILWMVRRVPEKFVRIYHPHEERHDELVKAYLRANLTSNFLFASAGGVLAFLFIAAPLPSATNMSTIMRDVWLMLGIVFVQCLWFVAFVAVTAHNVQKTRQS